MAAQEAVQYDYCEQCEQFHRLARAGFHSARRGRILLLFLFVAVLNQLATANDEKSPDEADGENHGDDACQCHDMGSLLSDDFLNFLLWKRVEVWATRAQNRAKMPTQQRGTTAPILPSSTLETCGLSSTKMFL